MVVQSALRRTRRPSFLLQNKLGVYANSPGHCKPSRYQSRFCEAAQSLMYEKGYRAIKSDQINENSQFRDVGEQVGCSN